MKPSTSMIILVIHSLCSYVDNRDCLGKQECTSLSF
uniref:Uncharacterized protein n=1 Tax=Anguilla anguilla TaxID=7936 RepID=A0A0E9Q2M9_ANGAN